MTLNSFKDKDLTIGAQGFLRTRTFLEYNTTKVTNDRLKTLQLNSAADTSYTAFSVCTT